MIFSVNLNLNLSSSVFDLKSSRLVVETHVCLCVLGKDDVLDVEIDSYIHCISAFVKLAQSEYVLLTEIIPEHHQKKTFDSLIQVRAQLLCVSLLLLHVLWIDRIKSDTNLKRP